MLRSRIVLVVAASLFACGYSLAFAESPAPIETDVFTSGKEGYHTYRIPALVVTKKGALLLICEGRKKGTGDHGDLTWSEVIDDPALVESVCQASFIRYSLAESGGKNRLLFSNPAVEKGRKQLTVRLSYDEGKTWPESKLLYPGGAAYSTLAALPGGEIGLVYERDNYAKLTFARLTVGWLTAGKDSP